MRLDLKGATADSTDVSALAAVGLGAALVAIALAPMLATRGLDRRSRLYFLSKRVCVALLGVGTAVTYWSSGAGALLLAIGFVGYMAIYFARRGLLGPARSSTPSNT